LIVIVTPEAIVVVPVPPMLPPVQEEAPERARSPLPSIVPPLNVKPPAASLAVRWTFPLETVAVSPAPGTAPQDHFVVSFQSPVVPFQTQEAAEA
jgi:hypothetical protein